MGSSFGFPAMGFGEWGIPHYNLRCFYKSGQIVYRRNDNDSCILHAIVTIAVANNNVSAMVVNNIGDELQIKNILQEAKLIMYNHVGQVLVNKKINEFNNIVSISAFGNGMYIIKLIHGNKNTTDKIEK